MKKRLVSLAALLLSLLFALQATGVRAGSARRGGKDRIDLLQLGRRN